MKVFKGYLLYKTISSQKVSSEAQVNDFCILQKSYVLFSKCSSFRSFSHPMIYLICDVVSFSTRGRLHFLNHNSLSHQTWPIDRYKQEQQFLRIFRTIWRTGTKFQVLFNLAICSNYSMTIYVKIPVFHYFEKVNKWQLKMVNVYY